MIEDRSLAYMSAEGISKGFLEVFFFWALESSSTCSLCVHLVAGFLSRPIYYLLLLFHPLFNIVYGIYHVHCSIHITICIFRYIYFLIQIPIIHFCWDVQKRGTLSRIGSTIGETSHEYLSAHAKCFYKTRNCRSSCK